MNFKVGDFVTYTCKEAKEHIGMLGKVISVGNRWHHDQKEYVVVDWFMWPVTSNRPARSGELPENLDKVAPE